MTKSEWGRAAFILHDNPAEPARIVLHGRDPTRAAMLAALIFGEVPQ